MDEIKLWKIAVGLAPRAVPLDPTDATKTEKLLEDILATAPDLLITGLRVLGRQVETPGGPLDLLGLDEQGNLVVFELKRGFLTRDAVAQVFDYASYLAQLDSARLVSLVTKYFEPNSPDESNFEGWFKQKFQRTEIAGRPKCVLVGLGADERAKRMVRFLKDGGIDIEMITFYGFREGDQTYLAKQVEVASPTGAQVSKTGKVANWNKLKSIFEKAGVLRAYEEAVNLVKQGLGESAYAYPFPQGYSFSLPGPSSSGSQTLLAYVGLYVTEKSPTKIRVYLQPRSIRVMGEEAARGFAHQMGGELAISPAVIGDIWLDLTRREAIDVLLPLSEAIRTGWLQGRQEEESSDLSEAEGEE